MAGKAAKKQSQQNTKILNDLYKVTIPIVSLALLRSIIWRSPETTLFRALFNFLVLHIPLVVSIYVIDSSGRPKYGSVDSYGKKSLISEGQDLSGSDNLFQYLFDVVYLSLFADIGRILFNSAKFWYVFLVCPVYVVYKVYSLKRQYLGSSSSSAAAAGADSAAPTKSKRQMKREKRGENQVKYRYR